MSSDIHSFLSSKLAFYSIDDSSLLQVFLSVAAGIFATKASDSSAELNRLFKVSRIETLLQEADDADDRSAEAKRLLRGVKQQVKSQVESEFARKMLLMHREQLVYHWKQILSIESLFDGTGASEEELDTRVRQYIQEYIIKTRYIEYFGKDILHSIPIVGGLLSSLFGPVWDVYYMNNVGKINKMLNINRRQENI